MMKKSKKWLATAAAATLLVGTLLAGTLAYFQDTEHKVNTFTTGKVDIELIEPDFDKLEDEDKILVPGREIKKDPTVVVKANSEDSYVRATVTIPANLLPLLEEPLDLNTGWSFDNGYYYYAGKVAKSNTDTALPAIFNHIQVKTSVINDQMAALTAADLDITVHAFAIQAEGFTDAAAAWAAYTP